MESSDVIDLLKAGIVSIEFTKLDGSNRRMLATLAQSLLPEPTGDSTSKNRDPDHQAVYDMEKSGWRSFLWSNVTKVNGVAFG